MDATTARRVLKALWFTPTRHGWGLPAVFWGRPGVGKSDVVEETAYDLGLLPKVLAPGEQGEAGYGNVPVPYGEGQGMRLATPPPWWVDEFEDVGGGSGIIFADELTTAPPIVQPALLGLTLARRLGNYTFPAGVRVVAASNPASVAGAAGHDLTGAQANRLGHFEWHGAGVPEWAQWLLEDTDTLRPARRVREDVRTSLESEVLARWPAEHAAARALVAGFIKARPALLHNEPAETDPQWSRAWPSRRSWAMCTRAIAGARLHGLSSTEELLMVHAYVGEAAGAELAAYASALDLPLAADLLSGKVKWKHDAQRLDRSVVVLQGIAAYVLTLKGTVREEAARVAWGIIDGVAAVAPDLCITSAQVLIRAGQSTLKEAEKPLLALRAVRVLAQ